MGVGLKKERNESQNKPVFSYVCFWLFVNNSRSFPQSEVSNNGKLQEKINVPPATKIWGDFFVLFLFKLESRGWNAIVIIIE